ncbi:hypothetical protein AJ80_00853 [Polytolypa hystricis UAMH7299]|uniref:Uncharacterized protein n=1 Tax=Polytolypa hystricis (strain UAMH7299) TaxID=1447883 RepID=A0A2B7Z1A9_POLH7|nr:hypothetical protein AJ80_00853 [Polytolypa hystricis UAMH7299]
MRPFHPIYALPVLGWMSQHGLVWAKLDSGAQLTRCAPTIIPGVDAATVDCVVQNNLDLLGDLGQLESDDSAVPKFEESDLDERDVQRSIHRRHASRVHKSGRRHHRTRMRKRQTKDDDEEDPKPKPKATPTSTTTTVAAKPKSTSKTSVTATTTTTSSKKGSKTTTAASTSSTSSESTKTTETSTASTTTESTSSASTTAAPPTSTSPKTTQTSSPTSPPAGVPIAGEGTGGVNAGVAAGSVFGGIAGVGLIFGGAFYYNRRRRNMQGANANGGAQKSSSHHLLSNIAKSGKGGSSIALIQQKGMPPLPNEHHTANSSKLDPMTEPQQEYSVVQGSRGGERHHTVAAPPTLHLPNIPRGSLSSIASSEFNYSNPPVKSRPTSSHDHVTALPSLHESAQETLHPPLPTRRFFK